jgi:solute carrier family 25 S-adenosylmethionine transporter 26
MLFRRLFPCTHIILHYLHSSRSIFSTLKRVLTFGSYEIYKQSLLNRFPNVKPAFIYALAAIMGDVTGSGWLCPSEVMKQQLQAGIYPSMSEAIKGIWNKSGVAGFYQGYTGGLARYV